MEAREKRILLCGCGYQAGNIGDDSILQGFVKMLSRPGHDDELGYLTWAENGSVSRDEAGLKVWNARERKQRKEAIKWASHVILGGGTLIADSDGVTYPLAYCCELINLSVAYNRPISLLASGISDLRSPFAEYLVKKYYSKFLTMVTIRSDEGYRQAVLAGIPENKITIAADAAFAIDIPQEGRWTPSDKIGINFTGNHPPESKFFNHIELSLKKLHSKFPALSMEGICSEIRSGKGYDFSLLKQLSERLGFDFNVHREYHAPVDFIVSLARYRLVVTMRMHIAIFCAMAGIPCVTIIREKKTNNTLKDLGLPCILNLESSAEELFEAYQNAIKCPSRFIPSTEKISELKKRVLINMSIWDQACATHTGYTKGQIYRARLIYRVNWIPLQRKIVAGWNKIYK
jgi:polysaccharide pyruvyl transferase WcaK-like protein